MRRHLAAGLLTAAMAGATLMLAAPAQAAPEPLPAHDSSTPAFGFDSWRMRLNDAFNTERPVIASGNIIGNTLPSPK